MREDRRPQYCYQVEDFTMPLPEQLEDMHATSNIEHPREALVLVIHVLMTELGFQIDAWQECFSDGTATQHTVQESLTWRHPDSLLKLHYFHPTCPKVSFSVAFMFVEPNVILHGLVSVDENSEGFSLNLRISDYVQRTFLSDPEPNKVYRNLPTLSRIVKDSISLPLLGWAQSVCNVPPTFGFMTLSSEIQLLILGYLNVRDLLAASRVNIDLFQLTSHPALWRKLFLKNFPSAELSPTEDVVDWRERYKREYQLRKEHRECALRLLPRLQEPGPQPPIGIGRPLHRPFIQPPMPFLFDNEFELRGLLPRPPRFLPPYLPEMPRRQLDPALPRPYFNRYGILPNPRLGPAFEFL